MPAKLEDLERKVEAVLFASGKMLTVHELTQTLRLPDHRPVQRALRKLTRAYSGRRTALEVKRVGDGYALQLREEYVEAARPVSPMEIPPRTLKVLTLVAYHQPVLQSLLVKMIGDSAYDEVQRLRDLNLVRADPKGSTLALSTTRAFADYFGIASTRPEEIRRFLEKKLGVTPTTGMGETSGEAPAAPAGPQGAVGSPPPADPPTA